MYSWVDRTPKNVPDQIPRVLDGKRRNCLPNLVGTCACQNGTHALSILHSSWNIGLYPVED